MALKLFNLFSLASLTLFLCALTPTSGTALANHNQIRHADHQLLALKKRAPSRRCKPRPTSSSSVAPVAAKTVAPVAPKPTTTSVRRTTSVAAARTSTTRVAASTPSPPPANTGGNCKAGVAWNNPSNRGDIMQKLRSPKVCWTYSWSAYAPPSSDNYDFRPMFWGPTSNINAFITAAKNPRAKILLGFNEPDHGDQATMSVGQAVDLWRRVMIPLRNEGKQLGSPAVTNGERGENWLKSFVAQCQNCFDYHVVHWYGDNADVFIAYVKRQHDVFGRPIIVSEFACHNFGTGHSCGAGEASAFMDKVTAFLDNTWYIHSYAWFGALLNMGNVGAGNRLIDQGGNVTPLGNNYKY